MLAAAVALAVAGTLCCATASGVRGISATEGDNEGAGNVLTLNNPQYAHCFLLQVIGEFIDRASGRSSMVHWLTHRRCPYVLRLVIHGSPLGSMQTARAGRTSTCRPTAISTSPRNGHPDRAQRSVSAGVLAALPCAREKAELTPGLRMHADNYFNRDVMIADGVKESTYGVANNTAFVES